jgi:subtilisin family serine protease
MNGTSFSSPVVSGVAALMLDANPGLGWRDVQEILAATAGRTGSPAGWSFNGADNWNGGGMHVSHDYGFGLVDAYAAVRVAESCNSGTV